MKLLIVEDQVKTGQYLRQGLSEAGFTTELAADGITGQHLALTGDYSLLILDVMLPGRDGWQILQAVRSAGLSIPVLFLTARDAVDDRVHGLELGADDYLAKPFNPRELVARVKAVLRRMAHSGEEMATRELVLSFAQLTINRQEYAATSSGHTVQLTAKEMDLLWHLASHPGRVFSREQLLESIWGYEYFGDTRTVDTHIKRIRQKLEVKDDSGWDIKTVWGVGYKFEAKP